MTLRTTVLSDRGVVSVSGEDAGKLLQGLVTNDMALLGSRRAIFAALLTPQGKILFDFLIVRSGDEYLLDTPAESATALVKRLVMYKLRSRVEIADRTAELAAVAFWGGGTQAAGAAYPDPRLAALGARALVPKREAPVSTATEADYHAHRIGLGVPEGGKDYAFGDTFPHEGLLDQLDGVSFSKGCFVGQEVVSRMEHRGTVRKRVVPVEANAPLPASGEPVRAGEAVIGTLGSVSGMRGLALLRLDRAADAMAEGVALMAGDIPVTIVLPSFATFTLTQRPETAV